jgi:formylglycine-generating enzyme required for sulfatase activity
MAGNAAEWTASDYTVYPNSKAKERGGFKVVRGGSYITDKVYAMTTSRAVERPDAHDRSLGFRCVKDID